LIFNALQDIIRPIPQPKMVWKHLREINQDAEHGPIDRGTDDYRSHRPGLRGDGPTVDAEALQSSLNDLSELDRQLPYITRRDQYRKQRNGTDQQKKRPPRHNDSIDVPITERRLGCRGHNRRYR
jgi:hypothetical protein